MNMMTVTETEYLIHEEANKMEKNMKKRLVCILILLVSLLSFTSALADDNMFPLVLSRGDIRNTEPYAINIPARSDNGITLTFRGLIESKGDKKIKGMESLLKPAPKGYVYLFPLLEIVNNGTASFSLDLMSIQLVTSVDGTDAYLDFAASIAGTVEDLKTFDVGGYITVPAGSKEEGYLPYCVPKNWKKLQIIIFTGGSLKNGYLFELNRSDL